MSDARSEARRRCFIGARIAFNRRSSTLDCLIRDISPSGARLEVARPDDLPDAFDLQILREKQEFQAEVMWRRARSCGVRLVARKAA